MLSWVFAYEGYPQVLEARLHMLGLLFLPIGEVQSKYRYCEYLRSLRPRILGLVLSVRQSYGERTFEELVSLSYSAWTGRTYSVNLIVTDHDVVID